MYPVSQELIDAIKDSDRIIDAKVEIDGVEYGTDNIQSFTFEDTSNPDSYLMIGSVAAAKIDLSLLDINPSLNLENEEYKVSVGIEVDGTMTYIPLGVFYADPDSVKRKKNLATLTLYDGMMKAQVEYDSQLVYPAPIQAVMMEIASILGVSFVGTLPIYMIPTKPTGYSCRGMIGIIAQLCGGFAKFNRDGNLTIRYYTNANFTIDGDNYIDYEKKRDSLYKIQKVIAKVPKNDSEGEGVIYTAGSGSTVMEFENPYATQAIVNDIYSRYASFSYIPTFLTMQGNPLLDVGDIVQLTTVDNEIINIPIMNNKLSFSGGLLSEIESVGETESSSGFSVAGSIGERLDALEENLWKSVLVNVISSAGNIFRNGVGSTTLTAKTFLNGIEVDVNGTRYEYRWHKYDKNGNYVPGFYQEGKSITINASSIDEKASFKVEVIYNDEVLIIQEITISNVFDGQDGEPGPQGPKGDEGKGVQSITVQYYVSTSNTTPTGDSWSDTKPTYQENKYLWIRYKIVYKNPTSEEYTQAVLDDSWSAVKVANEAKQEAQNAMTSADGKNTVFRQATQPPTENRKIGDLWFKTDEGNKMYVWTGEWTETKLDYQALSVGKLSAITADLGNITAGHIQGVEITANEGDFYVKDANSNAKATLRPLSNLINDPGFEGVVEGEIDFDNHWYEFIGTPLNNTLPYVNKNYWYKGGSPKIVQNTVVLTNNQVVARLKTIFGNKSAVVNNANFIAQCILENYISPGEKLTISAFFSRVYNKTGGTPRIIVQHRDANGNVKSTLVNKSFTQVPNDYSVVRFSETFTAPSTIEAFDALYISISSANSNWVQVDGVQLVYNDYPTVYDPDANSNFNGLVGEQEILWYGTSYPLSTATITPKVPLSQCKFGWLLKWQAFTPGGSAETHNYQYSIIPKYQVIYDNGPGMKFTLGRGSNVIFKYLYVYDDRIVGHDDNGNSPHNTLVLTEVLAI